MYVIGCRARPHYHLLVLFLLLLLDALIVLSSDFAQLLTRVAVVDFQDLLMLPVELLNHWFNFYRCSEHGRDLVSWVFDFESFWRRMLA